MVSVQYESKCHRCRISPLQPFQEMVWLLIIENSFKIFFLWVKINASNFQIPWFFPDFTQNFSIFPLFRMKLPDNCESYGKYSNFWGSHQGKFLRPRLVASRRGRHTHAGRVGQAGRGGNNQHCCTHSSCLQIRWHIRSKVTYITRCLLTNLSKKYIKIFVPHLAI